ncbi:hypothetical protein IJ818_08300 [bacterium]|nr:hypothetical protein [bacterium]
MKKYLALEIITVICANLFADMTFIGIFILFYSMLLFQDINKFLSNAYFVFILTIAFFRLFILPITYTFLENNSKINLIKKFIKILKKSLFMKIVVLCFSLIPAIISNIFILKTYDFKIIFLSSLYLGLLGSYLLLFIYWFVAEKIKPSR